jgi:glucosamine-6-phosphate deaminase
VPMRTNLLADRLKVEIYATRQAAAEAAARLAAERIRSLASRHPLIGIIFATGASQIEMLRALVAIPEVPWDQVAGFHMDEYLGISPDHTASFRHYLREHLSSRVALREFHEIDGLAPDPGNVCAEYTNLLRERSPKLCLLGVGENGHLAFNDPGEADFNDPAAVKVVSLDPTCREQQVVEGWFAKEEDVPRQALTLTIPTLMSVPELIVSVPGNRKAAIMKRVLTEPVSTSCPATILRTHPNATLFLDEESASELRVMKLV